MIRSVVLLVAFPMLIEKYTDVCHRDSTYNLMLEASVVLKAGVHIISHYPMSGYFS